LDLGLTGALSGRLIAMQRFRQMLGVNLQMLGVKPEVILSGGVVAPGERRVF